MTKHNNLLKVPAHLRTKGERADYLYGADNSDVDTYDCAVPLEWCKFADSRGFADAARHVVSVYYKDSSFRIMPVTEYGLRWLCTLATYSNQFMDYEVTRKVDEEFRGMDTAQIYNALTQGEG